MLYDISRIKEEVFDLVDINFMGIDWNQIYLQGKEKGWAQGKNQMMWPEIDQEEVRQTWVCQICGKNTYDVDWDYIGSGTNHLQCELELEFSEAIIENKSEGFIYESPDNGKTIFRRPLGDQNMKNKVEVNWETKEPTGRVFTDYPFD